MRKSFLLGIFLTALLFFPGTVSAVSSVTKTQDGTLVIDNKPTFLLGFYFSKGSNEVAKLLDDSASAQFNFLYTFNFMNAALLDGAAQRGIYVMPHSDLFDAHQTHPAIVGWGVKDDFNGPVTTPRYSVAQIATHAQPAKTAFPHLLTYSSGGGNPHYSICPYFQSLDAIGMQVYPISNPVSPFANPIENVLGAISFHRRQCPQNTLIANIQAFSWADFPASSIPNGRWPTTVETKQMFYAALINNVNGIVPFVYDDLPQTHPELWEEWKKLGHDFGQIKDDVLNGQWIAYDSQPWEIVTGGDWRQYINGKARVHGGLWYKDDRALVILMNTDQSVAKTINVPFTNFEASKLEPVFNDSRYGSGLQLQNNKIVGTMQPGSVHVYLATKNSTPPAVSVCDADINQDGSVNLFDYSMLVSNFLKNPPAIVRSDINQDGRVDLMDYSFLVKYFLQNCPGTPSPTP